MNRRIASLLLLSLFFLIPNSFAECKLDSLLAVLDQTLDSQGLYEKQKESRILELKKQMESKDLSKEALHKIYFDLYKEYEVYICDSALLYVQNHLKFSQENRDLFWENECKIQLARMYANAVQFPEAINLLHSIDKEDLSEKQLGNYYNTYADAYIFWCEYAKGDDIWEYARLKNIYQDSALIVFPPGSYDYAMNYGRKCIEQKNFNDAEKTLLPFLPKIKSNTREYAVLTSLLAYAYELMGNQELQKEYLAMSAISDVEASVKENVALRNLAFLLLKDGDVNRSNRYIKKSLEDANFYNALLRNIQISKILLDIDKAYQLNRERFQKNLQTAIVVICFLLLFLTGFVFYLIKQMNKLSRTRKKLEIAYDELKKTNIYLRETSHIKEEYIGLFLNQCSVYIDKLEAYRKALNKKAALGKMEELFQMIKSNQIIEDELKDFYHTFDSAFLNIFPDFVEQFNHLLPEKEHIFPKNKKSLTIELRIFALIRLGIIDSSKIANFLRYSITTIYNYRSEYRNKALVSKEDFEDAVMKIGTIERL